MKKLISGLKTVLRALMALLSDYTKAKTREIMGGNPYSIKDHLEVGLFHHNILQPLFQVVD